MCHPLLPPSIKGLTSQFRAAVKIECKFLFSHFLVETQKDFMKTLKTLIKPFFEVPQRSEKIKIYINPYCHSSLWCLKKRSTKAVKTCINLLEVLQRSVTIKIYVNFILAKRLDTPGVVRVKYHKYQVI